MPILDRWPLDSPCLPPPHPVSVLLRASVLLTALALPWHFMDSEWDGSELGLGGCDRWPFPEGTTSVTTYSRKRLSSSFSGQGLAEGHSWSSRRKGVPTMGSLGCAFQTHHFTAPIRPDLTSRP